MIKDSIGNMIQEQFSPEPLRELFARIDVEPPAECMPFLDEPYWFTGHSITYGNEDKIIISVLDLEVS